MTVKYVSGDLFLSRAQTLGHGVNCRGRMGAGIAVEFRKRFPEMVEEYQARCRRGLLRPGEAFLWKNSVPWVLNLATQDSLGGAGWTFVREALDRVRECFRDEGLESIALPRLAAGLGGLPWPAVRMLIDEYLGPLPMPVYVYEDYRPGVRAEEC